MESVNAQILQLGIQALDDTRFVELCNDLLISAAIANGIDRGVFRTNLRVTEPDGGIDARCANSPRIVPALLPRPNVAYQFKSGRPSKSAAQVATVDILGKSRVVEALSNGHAFVYIAAQDHGDRFEADIAENVRKLRPDFTPDQIVFIGGDTLARHLQARPAIIKRFLRLDQYLLSFDDWSELPRLRNPFQTDAALQTRLGDVRSLLAVQGAIIRVVGAAGHGKTRTVLEALRGSDLDRSVLYARESSEVSAAFIDFLRSTPDVLCSLVVDDVEDDDAERLQDRFARMPQGVRLVLIGRDASGRAQPGTLQVQGLNEELLVAAINAIVPSLPAEVPQTIARICERSPRLAVVIADRIKEDPSLIGSHGLLADGGIRQVLDHYLNLELRDLDWQALSAVALLERVGWTGSVDEESERLFRALDMNPLHARQAVEELNRRLGVAPRANRFRYVSPTILAEHLAARQLETWTRAQFEKVLAGLTPAMMDSFTRRLRRLAHVIENRMIVEGVLLGEGGPFRSLDDLEVGGHAMLLRHLSGAFPLATIRVLQRIIEPASENALKVAKGCRRELIYALEQLLWPRDTFETSARLLLRLAVAENETWANNATGLWVETFQTLLGRTAAGLTERLRVLRRAASSDHPVERRLAAEALGAALRTGHITRAGMPPEDVPGMPQTEWRPITYGDWYTAIKSYLDLLTPLHSDNDADVRRAAVRALVAGMQAAITFPRVTSAWLTTARTLVGGEHELRVMVLDAIETELRRQSPQRKASGRTPKKPNEPKRSVGRAKLLRQLAALHAALVGPDFSSRFRWLVSRNPWRLPDEATLLGGDSLDQRLGALAAEIIEQPSLLDGEWDWLRGKSEPIPERWFEVMGRHDRSRVIAPKLEALAPAHERAWLWLSLYDLGWVEAAGAPTFVDRRARELLAGGTPASHVLRFFGRAGYTRDRFALVQELVDSRVVAGTEITQFMFSPWLSALSEVEALQLAEAAAADRDAIGHVVSFIALYLHRFPEHRPTFRNLAFQLLARPWSAPHSFMEYEWTELADLYVTDAPELVAKAALTQAADREHSRDGELGELLRKAWQLGDKQQLFERVIAPWLDEEPNAFASWRLRETLRGFALHEVGLDHLEAWIIQKPDPRAQAIAELVGPPSGRPSDLHAMLLERFEDYKVGSTLFAGYVSGVFYGPASTRTRALLNGARMWADDERPAIRRFGQEAVRALEGMLQDDEAREAEERFR